MTPEQHETLRVYVATLADALGLGEWRISISQEEPPSGKGILAEVDCSDTRLSACIYFGPDFFTESPEEQRSTVVHELLHIILHPMQVAVESTEELLGTPAYAMFFSRYDNAEEIAVDVLSERIAPMFELIDWTNEAPKQLGEAA